MNVVKIAWSGLFGLTGLALAIGAGCSSPVGGAPSAQGPREITLPNGNTVYFHGDTSFGGFMEKGQDARSAFTTKAVKTVSAVTGTATQTGFIALVTYSGTVANQDIWLFRKGSASAGLLADLANAAVTGGHKQAGYASTFRSGSSIALGVPADIMPGSYGVGVVDAVDAATVGAFSQTQIKTAFTVTDNTTYVSAIYTGGGTATPAKAGI